MFLPIGRSEVILVVTVLMTALALVVARNPAGLTVTTTRARLTLLLKALTPVMEPVPARIAVTTLSRTDRLSFP